MKLLERLTDTFVQEGIILEEEREIVQFGLESIERNLVGVILFFSIGFFFNRTKDTLFLYLLLFPLRKSAGGVHAATKTRCLIISAIMLSISFLLFSIFDYVEIIYWICFICFGCIIWILAPVENPSKQFDEVDQSVYRMRSRIVLGVEGIIYLIAFHFRWEIVIRSVSMTFFIVSISLLMGILKNVLTAK